MFAELWFDVGIKRYTTCLVDEINNRKLWFDVGIKRYTTVAPSGRLCRQLWFDVGIKRYTTAVCVRLVQTSCGLM